MYCTLVFENEECDGELLHTRGPRFMVHFQKEEKRIRSIPLQLIRTKSPRHSVEVKKKGILVFLHNKK